MKTRTFSGVSFRYHPDPLKTGAFCRGEAVCGCCGETTSVAYTGPMYSEHDDVILCPACIATGKAIETFGGCFTAPDHCDDIGDPEKLAELCYRTPGYAGIQQERWLSHCGDYCAYVGQVTDEDMTEKLRRETAETWNGRPQRWDYDHVMGSLGLQFEGHLFRCLVCGKHLLYAQRD